MIIQSPQAEQPAQAAAIKDGDVAKVVNTLRDIALEFHGAQQLRQRIADVVVPLLKAPQPAFHPLTPERLSDLWRIARTGTGSFTTLETYTAFARAIEADHNAAQTSQPTHLQDEQADKADKAEIARLTACLKSANSDTEEFERKWYLRGDEIEVLLARPVQSPALKIAGTMNYDANTNVSWAAGLTRESLPAGTVLYTCETDAVKPTK